MHDGSGWYISGTSEMRPWVPLKSLFAGGIDWSVFLKAAVEIARRRRRHGDRAAARRDGARGRAHQIR